MDTPEKTNGKWLSFDTFRANLNSMIDSKGLLGKDLAAHVMMTPASISRYITGARDPELEYVYRLSRYFGTTIDYLLGVNDLTNSGMTAEEIELVSLYRKASNDDRNVVGAVLKKYGETRR